MNKHIVKRNYRNGIKLDIPIVWCGRSIPWNSEVITTNNDADFHDADGACKNCKSAIARVVKINSQVN